MGARIVMPEKLRKLRVSTNERGQTEVTDVETGQRLHHFQVDVHYAYGRPMPAPEITVKAFTTLDGVEGVGRVITICPRCMQERRCEEETILYGDPDAPGPKPIGVIVPEEDGPRARAAEAVTAWLQAYHELAPEGLMPSAHHPAYQPLLDAVQEGPIRCDGMLFARAGDGEGILITELTGLRDFDGGTTPWRGDPR